MITKLNEPITITLPKPHHGQELITKESKQHNIIVAHRGWWSSSFAMTKAIEAAVEGKSVGWFTPSMSYIDNDLYMFKKSIPGEWIKESKKIIEIPGAGSIHLNSLEHPHCIRGGAYSVGIFNDVSCWKKNAREYVAEPCIMKCNGTTWEFSSGLGNNIEEVQELIYRSAVSPEYYASWVIPVFGIRKMNKKYFLGASDYTNYANTFSPFKTAEEAKKHFDHSHSKEQWEKEFLLTDYEPK